MLKLLVFVSFRLGLGVLAWLLAWLLVMLKLLVFVSLRLGLGVLAWLLA